MYKDNEIRYMYDSISEDYVMFSPYNKSGMGYLTTYGHRKEKDGVVPFEINNKENISNIKGNKRYKEVEKKKWWRMRDKLDGLS